MPWYSLLHIWNHTGQREIHRHEIEDAPTLGDAILEELELFGKKYYSNPEVLAICPTEEADEIAKVFSRKLGLRYTIGNGIYPHEEEIQDAPKTQNSE